MNTNTLRDDQQLPPWGVVTPAFWEPEQPTEWGGSPLQVEPVPGEQPGQAASEASRPLAVQEWFGESERAAERVQQPLRSEIPAADLAQRTDEVEGDGPAKGNENPPGPATSPTKDRAHAAEHTVRLSKHRPADISRQGGSRAGDDRDDVEASDTSEAGGSASTLREAPAAEAAPAAPRSEGAGTERPQEPAPPPEYQGRLAAVIAAINAPHDSEGLAVAGIEAEKLDQELTSRFGGQHSHTVNIREIRGWLAFITGHPAVAARWYLHTTGLQIALHGARHEAAQGSVARAIHTWQGVKNPGEVLEIGTGLAKIVSAVLGEDSDAARFIQARVARYQQLPR